LNVKNNLVVNGDINISGTTVQDTSLVTDRDGNTYKTIRIGQQIWMAEDLKTAKYNDGTAIPNITDNTEWISYPHQGTVGTIMIKVPINQFMEHYTTGLQ